MTRLSATLARIKLAERGVTEVEYGLLVAFIATAIFLSVSRLGTSLSTEFTNLAGQVSTANAAK